MDANGKPESFAEALDITIDFLDLGDKAFDALAQMQGLPRISDDTVQNDLARVMMKLLNDPETDAKLMEYMYGTA